MDTLETKDGQTASRLSLSDRSQVLLDVNNAVVSHLDLPSLLRGISDCLKRLIPHDFAGLSLYDPEHQQMRSHALVFPEKQQYLEMGQLVPLQGTPPGVIFTSGKPLLRRRLDVNEFQSDVVLQLVSKGITSICGVPLIFRGKTLGSLGVASFREGAFSEDDVELMSQIGNQIAIAVQNMLSFERLRSAEQEVARERDRTRLLLEINNAVVSHLDLRDLVKSISASLRRVTPHDAAFLTLLDSEGTGLRVQALDLQMQDTVPFEEGIVASVTDTPEGEALATRRPVLVAPRVDLERFTSAWVKKAVEHGIKSGCAVPLIAHGRPLGALSVVSMREAAFNEEDATLLEQCSNQIAIAVENALAYQEIEAFKNQLAQEKVYLEDELRSEMNFEEIVGSSPSWKAVLKQVETVATTDSNVLIRGETGTGKELIARAIHGLSGRRERTLVKVNCAAIPTGLLESELFGHEKGAFTGAMQQRIGRFELAHRGTLFLDEVGDIPTELQPKLLRVLQEKEFERLGNTRTHKVDVRLVAATNCDLENMVADRRFRSDLFYRLNVFPITLPPLRARAEDIPALVRYFVTRYAQRMNRKIETIPSEAMKSLQSWHWPGNVRELENLIERAVIVTQGSALQVPMAELTSRPSSAPAMTLKDSERDHILNALRQTRGRVSGPAGAAARLGLKRTTLEYKMKKLGISRDEY